MRTPVPVMMMTSELPLAQPGRLAISWMTEVRSGVRWSGSAWPFAVHAAGAQLMAAAVRGREEMSNLALLNVAA